jgi:eukaryotic-like serine/threonine-protein kinase
VNDGQTIAGRYRLREPLGRGGMSVVWRADDELLGREVALKVLSSDVAADPDSLSRLHAEARSAAGLRHDNVVEVYDYGETTVDGVPVPYVVMQLVDGRPVSALLTGGALPWRLAVLIAAQVAAALAAAHDRGIVHRDVKPANVMVTSTGVKLVDFGISAAVGDQDPISGPILGTPAYLAPERLLGGVVRPATDVYALGLLLYMMLAGRLPWSASTSTDMLAAHRYRDPATLPTVSDLPAEVTTILRECLAKQPSERPAAVTVARILRRAAGLPPLTVLTDFEERPATPAEETRPLASPSPRRARLIGAATAGGLLAATGLTVALAWPAGSVDRPAAAAPPEIACLVTYTVDKAAADRTSATLTVTNEARTATGDWSLRFVLPGGQRLIDGSNGSWHQQGDVVQVAGPNIAPGAVAETSFDAAHSNAIALPQAFELNDVACRSQLTVLNPSAVIPAKTSPSPAARTVTHIVTTHRPKAPGPGGPAPHDPPKPPHQPPHP